MQASTGLNSQADDLIKWWKRRAKRGYPEVRRDWMFTPARINAGAWDAESRLEEVEVARWSGASCDNYQIGVSEIQF